MLKEIKEAMKDRKVVAFVYHGVPRIVHPHILGLDKNSDEMLSGYQTEGGSLTSEVPGWKNFKLKEIQSLTLTGRPLMVRRDYNPRDPQFAKVYCRI